MAAVEQKPRWTRGAPLFPILWVWKAVIWGRGVSPRGLPLTPLPLSSTPHRGREKDGMNWDLSHTRDQ